jgi:hypothetical protein
MDALEKCILFKGVRLEEAIGLISGTNSLRRTYNAGDYIALEGEP